MIFPKTNVGIKVKDLDSNLPCALQASHSDLSVPWFPHLTNKVNIGTYLVGCYVDELR